MSRRWIAVAVAVLALPACAEDAPTTTGTDPSPTTTVSSAPATTPPPATGSPSATASASTSPSPTGTMTVPVYYLGGTQQRPVLFREFRKVPRSGGVVRAAVDATLHLAPTDSDYYSLWPARAQVRGASVDGTTATVDLSADARSVTASRAHERASLQQLVFTVTAAAPAVRSVRLRFDGATKPTLWGSVDTSGSVSRGSTADVLAPIWVLEPAQGTRVGRTFTVKGSATVFEATVSWAVTRPGSSTQLAHGFVTATKGAPERGDFTVSVTLPAGTTGDVVFTAWESSANDGSVQHPDSKTYRVA